MTIISRNTGTAGWSLSSLGIKPQKMEQVYLLAEKDETNRRLSAEIEQIKYAKDQDEKQIIKLEHNISKLESDQKILKATYDDLDKKMARERKSNS